MAGKIFISYRRDDERQTAARLRDRLALAFGESDIFMDVDNLRPGQRFDRALEAALEETDILLVVIGPSWLDLLARKTDAGDTDYVRLEVAAALQREIAVIPVLVEGAKLPRAADLPEDISAMVLHQKHDLSYDRFGRDADALVEAIDAERRERSIPPKFPRRDPPSEPAPSQVRPPARLEMPRPQSKLSDAEVLPNRPNPLVIGAALVGSVLVGGMLAYGYKSFVASREPRTPAVKIEPLVRQSVTVETGKKQDAPKPGLPLASTDRHAVDRILAELEREAPPSAAGPGLVVGPQPIRRLPSVPGLIVDGGEQPTAPIGPGTPPKVAAATLPKLAARPGDASSKAIGLQRFVAVIASRASREDAFRASAELAQKYSDILADRQLDVREALTSSMTWHRVIVGPPSSRDAVSELCRKLADRGFRGCYSMAN